MKRVMIMGSPGSGKTRLAKKMGRITGIRVYQIKDDTISINHSDEEKEMWKKAVNEIVEKDKWIIEGTQSITFESRMREADTIIYIDEKPISCVFGFVRKTFYNYLYRRANTIRFSRTMIKKIMSYKNDIKPLIEQLIEENKEHIEYILLDSELKKINYLQKLRESIKNETYSTS